MELETGTAFIPCEENPYYRLATVHGVPDEKMSPESYEELRDRNRVTWNRYIVQGLDDSKKTKLKNQGVPCDEIDSPLTDTERDSIRQRLGDLEEPNYKEKIDFRKVQFDLELDMGGFVFPNGVDFWESCFRMKVSFCMANFLNDASFIKVKFSETTNFYLAKFSDDAYFRRVQFSGFSNFGSAEFSGYANFSGAKFSEDANFYRVQISSNANFVKVKFSGDANFKLAEISSFSNFFGAEFSDCAYFLGAKFSDTATFGRAKFSKNTNFCLAKFSGDADFMGAKFSGDALFTGAPKEQERREFGGLVNFTGATFAKKTDFTNRVFLYSTTFDQCEFLKFVPNFAEAKLHQATTWRDVVWPSLPMIDKTEAKEDSNLDQATKIEKQKEVSRKRIYRVEDQVDAYRNLRLRMKQIENYQQEVFFLGKELDAKRRVHWLNRAYFRWFPSLVYKLFSDYGTSLARPVGGLLCLIASFGALVFWYTAKGKAEALGVMEWVNMGMQSLWFSARYALPLIGPIDEWDQAISQSLPSGILVFTVGQTILGVVFLFLIGLALRNRFRIR